MAEGWGGLSDPPFIREPTAEEVRAYRVSADCSLEHAKRTLLKAALIDATRRATTVHELKQVVMRSVSMLPGDAGIPVDAQPDVPMIAYWQGERIDEISQEDLRDAITWTMGQLSAAEREVIPGFIRNYVHRAELTARHDKTIRRELSALITLLKEWNRRGLNQGEIKQALAKLRGTPWGGEHA